MARFSRIVLLGLLPLLLATASAAEPPALAADTAASIDAGRPPLSEPRRASFNDDWRFFRGDAPAAEVVAGSIAQRGKPAGLPECRPQGAEFGQRLVFGLVKRSGIGELIAPDGQGVQGFLVVIEGVLIPQARHEILQESDELRQRFWAVFDAYLGVDATAA